MAGRIFAVALVAGIAALSLAPGLPCHAEDGAEPVSELRRELVAWRKVLDSKDAARAGERALAMASIRGVSDPRAVPIVFDLWEKENKRDGSFLARGHFIEGLIQIGDQKAFLKLAEISVEDLSDDNRQRAASWIGAQDNRDDAIPIYTRALKSKVLFHNALSALGYAEIATKGKQPPDRELVAALVDNLITVIPHVRKVPVRFYKLVPYRNGYDYEENGQMVKVVEYAKTENSTAKQLLYAYTNYDLGYDQAAWRKNVVHSLPERHKAAQK